MRKSDPPERKRSVKQKFSKVIASALTDRTWNQTILAQKLNVLPHTLHNWIRTNRYPEDYLNRIAKELGFDTLQGAWRNQFDFGVLSVCRRKSPANPRNGTKRQRRVAALAESMLAALADDETMLAMLRRTIISYKDIAFMASAGLSQEIVQQQLAELIQHNNHCSHVVIWPLYEADYHPRLEQLQQRLESPAIIKFFLQQSQAGNRSLILVPDLRPELDNEQRVKDFTELSQPFKKWKTADSKNPSGEFSTGIGTLRLQFVVQNAASGSVSSDDRWFFLPSRSLNYWGFMAKINSQIYSVLGDDVFDNVREQWSAHLFEMDAKSINRDKIQFKLKFGTDLRSDVDIDGFQADIVTLEV